MSEKLHNALVENGTYTKSYEEFVSQFSTTEKQDELYKTLSASGDYSKSKEDFKNQFFTTVEKEETTAPKVKEGLTPEGTTVKEENTVSTGEESSTATSKVDWESPELKGEWVFNETGDNVWTRKYKDEKGVLVKEVVPSNNVPKEVLERHEGNNPVISEIEANKKGIGGQTQAEWVLGKDDVAVSDQSVVYNAASFSANVEETEEIQNNISSEVLLYQENLEKIKNLNFEINKLKKPKQTLPFSPGGLMPVGLDGETIDDIQQKQNTDALENQGGLDPRTIGKNENLLNPEYKALLNDLKRLNLDQNASRIKNYLQKAEKLWPKNDSKVDKEKYNAWLYKTASQLMEKDDKAKIMESKIAQHMEDNQGVLQVFDPEWATKEVEKSKEFLEILPEKMKSNLAQQNFLKTSVNALDLEIAPLVDALNKIDYSSYTTDIEKYDNELAELGPEVKSGAFAWTQLTTINTIQ